MKANEYQIGGSHYDAPYKHWDWVLDIGMQYLEAQTTRYLCRFDKKGFAVQDMEKAAHYVAKLRENIGLCRRLVACTRPSTAFVRERTLKFAHACGFDPTKTRDLLARTAIQHLALWETDGDLDLAAKQIEALRQDLLRAEPVPLEDSNKHALYDEPEEERSK